MAGAPLPYQALMPPCCAQVNRASTPGTINTAPGDPAGTHKAHCPTSSVAAHCWPTGHARLRQPAQHAPPPGRAFMPSLLTPCSISQPSLGARCKASLPNDCAAWADGAGWPRRAREGARISRAARSHSVVAQPACGTQRTRDWGQRRARAWLRLWRGAGLRVDGGVGDCGVASPDTGARMCAPSRQPVAPTHTCSHARTARGRPPAPGRGRSAA